MSVSTLLLPLAVICTVPAALFAQPTVAWWTNPLANGLDLSDDQKDEIATIQDEFRERISQKSQETERAEHALEEIFNADTIDWQRGEQAIQQLVRSRGELTLEISRMTLRMRAVLTSQQWRTLQARTGGRAIGLEPGGRREPGGERGKGRGRGRPNPAPGPSPNN